MHFKLKTFILFMLCLKPIVFANNNMDSLKDRVTNQSHKLNSLAAKIKDIDQRIGSTNNSFLANIKEIETIEKKADLLKESLNKSAMEISQEFNNIQLAFDHYILEKTEESTNRDIRSTTVHFEILQNRLSKLQKVQDKSKTLLDQMNKIEDMISAKKKEEQEIYSLIVELENQKKDMGKIYIDEMENQNLLQSKLDKIRASQRAREPRKFQSDKNVIAKEDIDFEFHFPMENYLEIKRKKKGLIFKYSSTVPVTAPGAGKIVYVGELASYGKVLIIDHGQDVRSVLLGDIVSKVTKNMIVKESQLLGYTMGDPSAVKSVYYEVRKKNIVQNTLLWLNKTQLKTVKI